jgi:transcription initiation factor TFIIIB Brf1 subunit/transcription initiation factor TFIIB
LIKDYFWFLGEIGCKLNVSSSTLANATKILLLAREKRVTSGRNPRCLAGAALYIAQFSRLGPLNERWTQKQVAVTAGIGEPAVRFTYHLLMEKLGLTVDIRRH